MPRTARSPSTDIARIDKKLDALIEAHTTLISRLAELIAMLAHPAQIAPATPAQVLEFATAPKPVVPRRVEMQTPDLTIAALTEEVAELAAEDDELPPEPDESEVWARRLRLFRQARLWQPDWGPAPGKDGCRVPAEML